MTGPDVVLGDDYGGSPASREGSDDEATADRGEWRVDMYDVEVAVAQETAQRDRPPQICARTRTEAVGRDAFVRERRNEIRLFGQQIRNRGRHPASVACARLQQQQTLCAACSEAFDQPQNPQWACLRRQRAALSSAHAAQYGSSDYEPQVDA